MPLHLVSATIDWTVLRRQFTELQRQLAREDDPRPLADLDSILNGTYEEDSADDENAVGKATTSERIDGAHLYAERLDATPASCPTGHAFINGKHFDLDDVSLRSSLTLKS